MDRTYTFYPWGPTTGPAATRDDEEHAVIDPGEPWAWEETDEMRSGGDEPPVRYVESGEWPDVVLRRDAPLSAYAGLIMARRLINALGAADSNPNAVSSQAEVSPPTIRRLMQGETVVSTSTILRLAAALRIELFPAGLYRVSAVDLYGVVDLDRFLENV